MLGIIHAHDMGTRKDENRGAPLVLFALGWGSLCPGTL